MFFKGILPPSRPQGEVVRQSRAGGGTKACFVTHPLLPEERYRLKAPDGAPQRVCYAKPVVVGNDVWLGANVVICPGVTIGDGCVIGAGSVVTRDIPPRSFAAGNPCRVIRAITEEDSMALKTDIAPGYTAYSPEELEQLR